MSQEICHESNVRKKLVEPMFYGIAHLVSALRFSACGFKSCFSHDIAFRQECGIAIPHFALVIAIPMEPWMRFYLGALWFIMISLELINTAIEAVVDISSPEWHKLAKKAKDCGSAAVFTVIVLFLASWMYVLIKLGLKVLSK